MIYIALDPRFDPEQLGFLPSFLSEENPDNAAEQYDTAYVGGWRPQPGWKFDPKTLRAQYPGDPPKYPFAMTTLHDTEVILFYPHAYVLIQQADDSFEMARMD